MFPVIFFPSDGKTRGETGWNVFVNTDWTLYRVNQFSSVVTGQHVMARRRSSGLSDDFKPFVSLEEAIGCISLMS